MNPLTVLLWLLCAFICVAFIAVPTLIVYMNKQRKKAVEEFNAQRKQMGLKPIGKGLTKGPSQGV